MSRVQKGGLVFKPVAKARPRATSTAPKPPSTSGGESSRNTASKQASSTSAGNTHGSITFQGDSTLSSMPPPAFLPNSTVSGVSDLSQPVASTSRAPSSIVPSSSRISAPPSLILRSSQHPRPRSVPAPPVITSRPTTAPNLSSTLINPATNTYTTQEFQFPENLASNPSSIDPSALLSTQDTLVPPEPSTSKKTSSRTRKKVDVDGKTTDEESEKSKKGKRKPAKKKAEEAFGEGDATEDEPKKTKRKRTVKKTAETNDDGDAMEGDGDPEQPKRPRRTRAKEIIYDSDATDGDDTPKRAKRKRAAKKGGDDDESTRPRKKRKPKVPAFDSDAEPGEEIDPTVITMAELCVDNGQGRISSKAMEIQRNHLAWKQQSREKRARMKALAEQKKYGRPEGEDGDGDGANVAKAPETPAAEDPSAAAIVVPSQPSTDEPSIADASGHGFDYSKELTASRFTVQVRLGPNGETIIDEESLTVDRAEEPDTSNYVHVVESDHTKFVNSQSYTKKLRGSRWSAEETDLFFEALAQHGENYELLSLVLPGRTRTACKNKFKAEDRKDSAKITRILETRLPIDISTLGRLTGRDFSGPVPIIKAPTPPPPPDHAMPTEPQPEVTTAHVVRKRSRSRPAAVSEGVEIIGSADTYVDAE